MSGFVDRLVAHALGTAPVLRVRPRSRFEPRSGPPTAPADVALVPEELAPSPREEPVPPARSLPVAEPGSSRLPARGASEAPDPGTVRLRRAGPARLAGTPPGPVPARGAPTAPQPPAAPGPGDPDSAGWDDGDRDDGDPDSAGRVDGGRVDGGRDAAGPHPGGRDPDMGAPDQRLRVAAASPAPRTDTVAEVPADPERRVGVADRAPDGAWAPTSDVPAGRPGAPTEPAGGVVREVVAATGASLPAVLAPELRDGPPPAARRPAPTTSPARTTEGIGELSSAALQTHVRSALATRGLVGAPSAEVRFPGEAPAGVRGPGDPSPDIHVHIDRVEIVHPAPPAPVQARPRPAPDHDAYLARRRDDRR